MEVHPDAPANPLYDDLKELFDLDNSLPNDYRMHGTLRHIQIAEHNEAIINRRIIETQNICLPTLNNLRNERNFAQLQERVYQKFNRYFDVLNVCILKSRTNEEADHCFNQFETNFEVRFKPELKKILLDY